jgi:uncharacterized protein
VQINVSQQLKASVGLIRNYEVSETLDIEGNNSVVEGNIRLMRTDRGILAEGLFHTEVELNCSRCLNLFKCTLTLNIEEEYYPTTDIISGNPLPSPDEPGSFTIDEHNILDLTEAIRQYAILAKPMKPLCRIDCAGLCPTCGTNLNLSSCKCSQESVNPRWSKLSKIVTIDTESSV